MVFFRQEQKCEERSQRVRERQGLKLAVDLRLHRKRPSHHKPRGGKNSWTRKIRRCNV
jgi:hypothetical protein